jgi:hypothetical protein
LDKFITHFKSPICTGGSNSFVFFGSTPNTFAYQIKLSRIHINPDRRKILMPEDGKISCDISRRALLKKAMFP